ncbi:chemoreceptor glutamine deamidase CheD [Cellvibrio sp. OA-2007]|uniref:chemoreceptor glutamine deamidase CheD n=1 Tax=Cellvibrio sp. OA-2007 TaxID=529823 RepID=UPI0007842831|nr:chemoreceptor glutamine deamidase CheD [Cellvibrio sp. OA-2007]
MVDENNVHLAPTVYYDRHFMRQAVKILPGEYYVTAGDKLIVTVLGSCVAVCLRDKFSGIGGMNHFLLPSDNSENTDFFTESARYGVYAMELLVNHLLKMGANRGRFEAKDFGGGNVLRGLTHCNVGQRNVEFVLDYLQIEQIPVVAQDLLGDFPRKVYFFPDSGQVLVKKIKSLHNTTISDRESEYRMRMKYTPKSGGVELFD